MDTSESKNKDYLKFLEEFSKKSGINYEFVKKSVDMESNFKIPKKQIGIINTSFFTSDKFIVGFAYTNMVIHEIIHINGNITHKVNITNKRIHEWIKYSEDELSKFRNAQKSLREKGEKVTPNFYYVHFLQSLKERLIKKFWWRLGWYGITERYGYYKRDKMINEIDIIID